MKAKASISPVFIRNGIVSLPRPDTKFIAPGGSVLAKASTIVVLLDVWGGACRKEGVRSHMSKGKVQIHQNSSINEVGIRTCQ